MSTAGAGVTYSIDLYSLGRRKEAVAIPDSLKEINRR